MSRKLKDIPKPLLKRFRKRLYTTEHETGEHNVQLFGMDIHNPVFVMAAMLVVFFVAFALVMPELSNTWLNGAKSWSVNNFDWLFMLTSNLILLFCIGLVFSPYGKIRIGGINAKPEFSKLSWFAMLFAAGMGIGLMFWSTAEPLAYASGWYGTPLNVEAGSAEAYHAAMGATMYHWGLHAWAIYAIVGLALAVFAFNFKFPLSLRSIFYPLLGERVWGVTGHIIDTLAVVATIFGLSTSLGLGAQQVASGLHFLYGEESAEGVKSLFGIEFGLNVLEIGVIAFVTMLAVISVTRGLEGGVKVLSNLNMLIALVFFLFVFMVSNPLQSMANLASTTVDYAKYILPLSNPVGRTDNDFYHGWSVFYWAWWVSWSPFVGMFIARISKGRTVREFVSSVVIIPTIVTMIWMSVFGQVALDQYANQVGELANGVTDASLTLFQMLEQMPLSTVTSIISIILVMVFFVTSSDSGSLVVDTITAGGKLEAPVPQRVFWAVAEGCTAAALLYGGGKEALKALQAGTVSTGLPFSIVLVVMCVSLLMGLKRIHRANEQLFEEFAEHKQQLKENTDDTVK
ncbi:MAG: glycine/betaine ABC transporter [Pseudomonadales bacterium]|nr:MAG: glycine/betaine ABC transporter [Pseudomonadales bacterium]